MALAKGAEILHIPIVITTHNAANNGTFLHEIVEMFLQLPVIDRKVPGFDALGDKDVLEAVMKTGRKQPVISGLWTSMAMTLTTVPCPSGRFRRVWRYGYRGFRIVIRP